jgi:ribosomal protein S27AE
MSQSAPPHTVSGVGSLTTIDAERCPTCSETRFVVLRGNRVACPTCCSTIRSGELYASDAKPVPPQTRRSTIFIALATATGVILALWANGLLTLHK